ncbi:hypothetical protein ACPW7J_10760 [Ihubacter sp. rT4E-8]|uniref:hypothetical protein n=1 Tax=Ihubacter sp. rT4E-8 TaxID=3242369 RepID=UPI003CEC0ED8
MMMRTVEFIADHIGMVFGILLVILLLIASVRSVIKYWKGQKVSIPPVGIAKDLPGSVTGINKYKE